jgi:hypothetical protein
MPICPPSILSKFKRTSLVFGHAIVVLKTNTKKWKNLSETRRFFHETRRFFYTFKEPDPAILQSLREPPPPYTGWYPTKERGALGVVNMHEKVLRLMRKALRVLEIHEKIFQIKRTSELTLWGSWTLNCAILLPKTSVFFLGWFSQNKTVGVDRL